MSLNKEQLKIDIVTVLTALMAKEEVGIEDFAEGISEAVDKFVKTADIKYTSGLTAGSTAVTGNFNGQLE